MCYETRSLYPPDRGMLFCLQEAILYVRGKDPICPGYSPRWWPAAAAGTGDPTTTAVTAVTAAGVAATTAAAAASSPQIRASLVGSWFEGRRVGAASLLPWQMRRNLFGEAALEGSGARAGDEGGGVSARSSRVRADGTRVPPMMVLPLSAVRDR